MERCCSGHELDGQRSWNRPRARGDGALDGLGDVRAHVHVQQAQLVAAALNSFSQLGSGSGGASCAVLATEFKLVSSATL